MFDRARAASAAWIDREKPSRERQMLSREVVGLLILTKPNNARDVFGHKVDFSATASTHACGVAIKTRGGSIIVDLRTHRSRTPKEC